MMNALVETLNAQMDTRDFTGAMDSIKSLTEWLDEDGMPPTTALEFPHGAIGGALELGDLKPAMIAWGELHDQLNTGLVSYRIAIARADRVREFMA